jgi:hypothetical protein
MGVTMQAKNITGVYFPIDEASLKIFKSLESGNGVFELPVRLNYLPFDGESIFVKEIIRYKILQSINEACGTKISENNEVILPLEQLDNAIDATKNIQPFVYDDNVLAFTRLLIAFLSDAKKANRPVLWVI